MVRSKILAASVIIIINTCLCLGTKETFKHEIHVDKRGFGRLKLDSRGRFADIIHLDTDKGIKRLLCRHDKILVAFKEFTVIPDWRPGQIVLGGSTWGCSLSSEAGWQHEGIYARVLDVYRPKDNRLDLKIGPVGPFDLLDEASIHLHFDPDMPVHSKHTKTRRKRGIQHLTKASMTMSGERTASRTKRGTSNMLTDILNKIDWHKNVSMFVPFNFDARQRRQLSQFSLRRNNGSEDMHVSVGTIGIKELLKVPEHFSLDCVSCFSIASLRYTFDLKINKINNKPVLKQYISQVESDMEMHTDIALRFREEMTINGSKLFWRTKPKDLLRIPIASVPGLPPVELLLSYDMDIFADIHAAVNTPTVLRNRYFTKGSYVMSQTMASDRPIYGDVSVYNWTVTPLESQSMIPSFAKVKTSFKHRMGFNASLLWSGKDVSIKLSPQMDITLEPDVNNQAHSDYFGKCHHSSVDVAGNFTIQDAYFQVQAFGKEIWNKYLASGYKKRLPITSRTLKSECKARCVGPVSIGYPNTIEDVLGSSTLILYRNNSQFYKRFRRLVGNSMIFQISNEDSNCPGCSACDESNVELTKLCSARFVTRKMATALARLHRFAETEWPNRYLAVIEGLDESPEFKHNRASPFREGRAMVLGLTEVNSTKNSTSLSNNINKIRRLGQLAVCSEFNFVAIRNMSGQLAIEIGVTNETNNITSSAESKTLYQRSIFDMAIQAAGSKSFRCPAKVQYKIGDSHPAGRTLESWCGPATGRTYMLSSTGTRESLYEYPFNDIEFKAEGRYQDWCGSKLRQCKQCNQSITSGEMVSWDSCMTRVMVPRLALRMRKLATIAKQNSIDLQVDNALTDEMADDSFHVPSPLFYEGRAARITLTGSKTSTKINLLMNAAICAGFDYVQYTSSEFLDVFVRRQDSYTEKKIFFPSGRGLVSVQAPENLTLEYGYPLEIAKEARQPALMDGHDDRLRVSKHYTISDFKMKADRDFRLDPSLVECLEEVSEEVEQKVEVVPGFAYKTRSDNMKNTDTQHVEEKTRHRSGQAVRVTLGESSSSKDLIKLGISLMRKCQPLLQQQQRCIGIGCHKDSLYVDIRPVMAGEEASLLHVWNSGDTDVYKALQTAAETVNNGGPLITPIDRPSACASSSMVSVDRPYLSFQLGYSPSGSGTSDFCRQTKHHLSEQATKLQERLSSAAGSDNLPRRDIMDDINACVVDACGGCPGTGPIWDRKVRMCSKMIGKYLSKASSPYRAMVNKTSFFNPDNAQSTVHSLACHDGNICVENTQLYSLLMPLITAKYRISFENSVEERLFNNEDNPSPLLEIVGQELAMHTSGLVKVYIDTLGDISRIRNVLKVVMVYNKNVSHVEFHVSRDINTDSVMATIQRKIEIWSGSVCSDFSRLSITPFSVHAIHEHRLKRSIERSQTRNQAKLDIRNWEMEWVSKL